MKVYVGSNEIFSSVFFARSFESFFIHLLLTKRCHIFQFINITSVLASGKFIRQRAFIFSAFLEFNMSPFSLVAKPAF